MAQIEVEASDERILWVLDRACRAALELDEIERWASFGETRNNVQLLRVVLEVIEPTVRDDVADSEVKDKPKRVMDVARLFLGLLGALNKQAGNVSGEAIADLMYVRTTTKQPIRKTGFVSYYK
jgi:hypothetical protein